MAASRSPLARLGWRSAPRRHVNVESQSGRHDAEVALGIRLMLLGLAGLIVTAALAVVFSTGR